jgi:tryptophanyl-tRNA synthetase
MSKSTVLSCIQPSGELHIGNYFGAIANWVRLQEDYQCIYGVVDLHAMTMPYRPEHLREYTEQMVIDLLACGIDFDKSILFIQSLVPEHTELCWIFNCVCSYNRLTRQAQWKEKSEQLAHTTTTTDKFISSGLFTYPVLQAADILMYRAELVPVGKDQEKHLELAKEIVERFNKQFGNFFKKPEMLPSETPKIYSLADPDQKMSKSLGPKHYVGLFEDENSVRAKVRSAVTDSGALPPGVNMSPGVESLFGILKACGKREEAASLLKDYEGGNRQYSRLKDEVANALVELTAGFRATRAEIKDDAELIGRRVRESSARARELARETLKQVRELVGLPAHG